MELLEPLYWVEYCALKKPLLLTEKQTGVYVQMARATGLIARVYKARP